MKDIFKTALILSLIAIVAGALLGYVNQVTYVSDEEIINGKLKVVYAEADSFKAVENASEKYQVESVAFLKTIYIPYKAEAVVEDTYIYDVYTKGFGGTIELLVLVKDNKVTSIEKVTASETPGMGAKAFNDKFKQQFMNLDLSSDENFVLTKTASTGDSEVTAVSGATITSNAMVAMMNVVASVHRQILAEEV